MQIILNTDECVTIHDAITNVSNVDNFIEYCRDKKNTIDYSNRLDKLEEIFNTYKKTIDDLPITLLEKFCTKIANKVKESIQKLRDNEEYLDKDLSKLTSNKAQYFTDKEIELITAIGNLNRIIWLFEMNTLYDTLYEKSVQMTIQSKQYAALAPGEQKVKALTGEIL